MMVKLKEYRIIRDGAYEYKAQVWRLWFPFWVECFFVNSSDTQAGAKEIIEKHKNKVVYIE